jgi:cytochrome c553
MRLFAASVVIWPGLAAVVLCHGPTPARSAEPTQKIEFFEKKIRPLLVENCFRCHGAVQKPKGGLRLNSRETILQGGDTGPAIVSGQPGSSLLIKAVGYKDPDLRMPPRSKLADEQIADLAAWVQMGAPWPTAEANQPTTGSKTFDLQERRKHWAFQPLKKTVPPAVKRTDWRRSPLDAFVLARLEANGLSPAGPADKRTLLRRATYDLTGLPPTPAEIDAFLADESPTAYAKVVERLLASPHYGERWGRHWLDLVRFAETAGHEFDFDLPAAYAYRDYIIRAFNGDLPYDQLVVEHMAGDLLTVPRRHPVDRFNESIIGTGYYFLGEAKHSPVDIRGDAADRTDNQIDVWTKTFLGLTVSCARCHDHKFDAISNRDYYALAGYLRSSRYQQAFYEDAGPTRELVRRLKELRSRAQPLAIAVSTATRQAQLAKLPAYLLCAREAGSPADVAHKFHLDTGHLGRFLSAYRKADRKNITHPLYAWFALADASRGWMPAQFTTKRQALVKRLREQQAAAELDARYAVFEDFQRPTYGDWFVTGGAFGAGPSRGGELLLQPDQRKPVRQVLAAGMAHSGLLAGKLQGVLRSPTFTIRKKNILYRLAGRDVQVNLIIDGFQQIREPIYGKLTFTVQSGDRPIWHVQDVSMWNGHRAYIEILDHGPGHVAVEKIVFADHAPPADGPNRLVVDMLDDAAVNSPAKLAHKYQALFLQVLDQWQMGKLFAAKDHRERLALLNALLQDDLFGAIEAPAPDRPSDASTRLAGLLDRYRLIEAALPEPKKVMAMADGTGENEHLFIRGSHKNLGPEVPRRFLEAIVGDWQAAPKQGSGRLELARRMVDRSNPLPARVIVNRLWQHHFGEGIVRSPDNFGVLGEPPSHPELLDWLAAEIIRSGWSIKHMHRLMVLSSTYRMASRPNPAADKGDPQNNLLHRMPIRRLEAECIRDALLAVSGRLDQRMFGPSVLPHLSSFMIGRGRPASGPLDGAGRRSIYINVRRNFLTPMFLAFDYPVPFTTIGRRSVSNVPAQALTMLNNPFVVQQARTWAERVLGQRGLRTRQRVGWMYVTAFGRPPSASELEEGQAFLAEQGKQYGSADDIRAWSDLAHVLVNVKEFVFLN